MFSRSFLSTFLFVAAFMLLGGVAHLDAQMLKQALGLELGASVPIDTPTPAPEHKYVAAKVLKRVSVSYPVAAHLNRVEGVVRIKISIDDTGHPQGASVSKSSGSKMLDEAVLDPRLKQWVFQPATLDGKAIPAAVEQEFEFRLDLAEEREIATKRLALQVGTPDPPYPAEAAAKSEKGSVTLSVLWEKENGLVDKIFLVKSSGSRLLDHTAMRFAYENWRTDPDKVTAEQFVKTVNFTGK